MTGHIDTMQEWWKLAEVGIPQAGDTVIFDERHRGRGFHVTQATTDHPCGYDNARILARAPKPKPAWYDAVAVIAETKGDDIRRAFVPQYDTETGEERVDTWADWQGAYDASELIGPVPLIEAKVTDEMVDRVREYKDFTGRRYFASREGARHLLAIALGLETE